MGTDPLTPPPDRLAALEDVATRARLLVRFIDNGWVLIPRVVAQAEGGGTWTLAGLRNALTVLGVARADREAAPRPMLDHTHPAYRDLTQAVRDADESFRETGDAGTRTWLDDHFLPVLTTLGWTLARVGAALGVGEAP